MTQFAYRLQALLDQKEQARVEAEKALSRAERECEEERCKLRDCELRVQQLTDRRDRMRREVLVTPSGVATVTAHEAQERSNYIRHLGTEIEAATEATAKQRRVSELSELRVEKAKTKVASARREVELLTKHRSRLEERFRREAQAKEDLAIDEIGSALYSTRRHSA